jgi:hypothetical protein
MNLLEDITTYLVSKQLVKGVGMDTFLDFMPESPDNIVVLSEYKGDPLLPHTDVAHRSVQVVVRNESATAAQELAIKLCKAFLISDDVQRINFTSSRWGQVHVRQAPLKIKQDDRDRTHYGFNLGITTTLE